MAPNSDIKCMVGTNFLAFIRPNLVKEPATEADFLIPGKGKISLPVTISLRPITMLVPPRAMALHVTLF